MPGAEHSGVVSVVRRCRSPVTTPRAIGMETVTKPIGLRNGACRCAAIVGCQLLGTDAEMLRLS